MATTKTDAEKKREKVTKMLDKLAKDDKKVTLGEPIQIQVNYAVLARKALSKIATVKVFAPSIEELEAWKETVSEAEVEAFIQKGVNLLKLDCTDELIIAIAKLLPTYFQDPEAFKSQLKAMLTKDFLWISPRIGAIMDELSRLCPIQIVAEGV